MFFLGLLSTPLPYLLLAAFYFFGFAFGVFNNSTNDEAIEADLSKIILTEISEVQENNEATTFYASFDKSQKTFETILINKPEDYLFPDIFDGKNSVYCKFIPDFEPNLVHFSRPPPKNI